MKFKNTFYLAATRNGALGLVAAVTAVSAAACGAYKQIDGKNVGELYSSEAQIRSFQKEAPGQDLERLSKDLYVLKAVSGRVTVVGSGLTPPAVISFEHILKNPGEFKPNYNSDGDTFSYADESCSEHPSGFYLSNHKIYLPIQLLTAPGKMTALATSSYSVSMSRNEDSADIRWSWSAEKSDLKSLKAEEILPSQFLVVPFMEGTAKADAGKTVYELSEKMEGLENKLRKKNSGSSRPSHLRVFSSQGLSETNPCELTISHLQTEDGKHILISAKYQGLTCNESRTAAVEKQVTETQVQEPVVPVPAVTKKAPVKKKTVPKKKATKKPVEL